MFHQKSVQQIHQEFLSGALSPREVASESVNRFRRFEASFHAWVSFDEPHIFSCAEQLRTQLEGGGRVLQPFDGIPIGVKDVFNTCDFPTQMGSDLWAGFTPGNDARVVSYLKNVGGIIAGKTVTAEFAVHALNHTLNPHDVSLTPGTSSSGSAVAVSLGIVPVCLGTQTGASIIRPASFCGVYGYKPSFGLLPRTGCLKTTDSLDTIGFLSSHADNLRPLFNATRVRGPNFPISNRALKDATRQTKRGGDRWRVAFFKTYTWEQATDEAKNSLLSYLRTLGSLNSVEVEEVPLPERMIAAHQVHSLVYEKSLSYYFQQEAKSVRNISPIMKDMIFKGEKISTREFHEALREQERMIEIMDSLLSEFDAGISLSTAGEAPKRGDAESDDPSLIWTLSHLPTISVPQFLSQNELPFGLQIFARKYNDYLLLNFLDFLRGIDMAKNASPPRGIDQ